jgi:hypothetical protein
MEYVVFIVVGIALYFLADFILKQIEKSLGHALENRSIVFLFILLGLALTSFWLIPIVVGAD